MDELLELMKSRRSIRSFLSKEVEREKLDLILEAFKWAPSAGNLQARCVYVVNSRELKEKLAYAAYNQMFIAEAPIVLVVCADTRKSSMRYGSRGAELYCIQDASAGIQNMLLMAHKLGLGTCWVGAFDEDRVRAIMGLREYLRPVAIIPLGYPAEKPRYIPSRKLEVYEEGIDF